MPRTDFHRPNPLDSDVIMDATARLLAPRRLTLTPVAREERGGKEDRPGKGRHKQGGKKQGQGQPASRQAEKRPSAPRQEGRAGASRKGGRRGRPEEPQRPHPKDSTEQPSLMKPYYLDLDR